MSRKVRVLFIINSLAAGGAERQLTELVRNMDKARFDIHVVIFYPPGYGNGGELWPEMEAIPGMTLHCLHKRRGPLGYLKALPRLASLILRTEADIIHGYLEGNLPALLLGRLFRRRAVWGIRRSFSDLTQLDRLSRVLLRLIVWLARYTDLVIFNSETSRANHIGMGMVDAGLQVIPNGFDIHRFHPDPALRASQRTAWGIPAEVPLVGIVGRLDAVKDHPTFLKAAAQVAIKYPEARFICVGRGPEGYTQSLKEFAISLGLGDRVIWAGVSREMPSVYNALDVIALTSTDEGFPNVLGEAMACGIPGVATRVGDAAILVGPEGIIAQPGDVEAISRGLEALLSESPEARKVRSSRCRNRIVDTFSVEALARRTETQFLELMHTHQLIPTDITAKGSPRGGARYILRLDDLCPTQDWRIIDRFEALLDRHGIKPVVAVIPDNQDPRFDLGPAAPDFWARVRSMQAKGWTIGLHGYQHRYVTAQAGILGMAPKSEFSGLPYEEQYEKLRKACDIFARNGVTVDAWVAPGHSFDWTTVAALNALGIRNISDGHALRPYRDHLGNTWVPQQFAMLRPMPRGTWTTCYHPDDFETEAFWEGFEQRLRQLGPQMITFQEALAQGDRARSLLDRSIQVARHTLDRTRQLARIP